MNALYRVFKDYQFKFRQDYNLIDMSNDLKLIDRGIQSYEDTIDPVIAITEIGFEIGSSSFIKRLPAPSLISPSIVHKENKGICGIFDSTIIMGKFFQRDNKLKSIPEDSTFKVKGEINFDRGTIELKLTDFDFPGIIEDKIIPKYYMLEVHRSYNLSAVI